jgi:hypothetical protein
LERRGKCCKSMECCDAPKGRTEVSIADLNVSFISRRTPRNLALTISLVSADSAGSGACVEVS